MGREGVLPQGIAAGGVGPVPNFFFSFKFYAIVKEMGSVDDKLSQISEDIGKLKQLGETHSSELASLRQELRPLFFQAAAISFVVKAIGLCASVGAAVGALFPQMFSFIFKGGRQ